MKAKAKKKVSAKQIISKSKPAMGMWMIIALIVVVSLVGLKAYNKIYMNSADVNLIGQTAIRELEIAKWTFDTSVDFHQSTGVWGMSAPSLATMSNIALKDGQLVLPQLNKDSQLVARSINLPMTEEMTDSDKYVIVVKAGVVEQVRPINVGKPIPADEVLPEFPKSNYKMTMLLIDSYLDENDYYQYRTLESITVPAKTNDGQQTYEFVVSKKLARNINRIRFYLYDNTPVVVPLRANGKPFSTRYSTSTTMYIDDITVLKRVYPRNHDKPERSPNTLPVRSTTPRPTRSPSLPVPR